MKSLFVSSERQRGSPIADVLCELLDELGEVCRITACEGVGGDDVVAAFRAERFDRVVVLDCEIAALRLVPLGLRNAVIVLAPDRAAELSDAQLQQLVLSRFATFDRALHTRLQRLDCRSAMFEFAPAPTALPQERARPQSEWRALYDARRSLDVAQVRRAALCCRALGIRFLDVRLAAGFGAHAVPKLRVDGVAVSAAESANESPIRFAFDPPDDEGFAIGALEARARGEIVVAQVSSQAAARMAHLNNAIIYDPLNLTELPVLSSALADSLRACAMQAARTAHDLWRNDRERLSSLLSMDGRRRVNSDESADFGLLVQRAARARLTGEGRG